MNVPDFDYAEFALAAGCPLVENLVHARCVLQSRQLAQIGLDDCQRMPGLKALLLRKVGKSNLEALGDLRQKLFRNIKHTFSPSRGVLTFPNGSVAASLAIIQENATADLFPFATSTATVNTTTSLSVSLLASIVDFTGTESVLCDQLLITFQ
jgi:hypothetical protein